MRVRPAISARRWPCGLLLLVALALVACSTSPSEQLLQAENKLGALEGRGAEQYLTYELAELRRGIEEARKDMRNNRADIAGASLSGISRKLDSCNVAFQKLKSYAESRSRKQVAFLGAQLKTLEGALEKLPKLTYVDQNRYDIHMHRLRRYHKDLQNLETLIANESFPEALEKGSAIQLQVAKIFSGLSETTGAALFAEQRQAENISRTQASPSRLTSSHSSVTAQ